jgi:hypothetical protein
MRTIFSAMLTCGCLAAISLASQPPGDDPGPPRGQVSAGDVVDRLMAFDKDGDGKLTKAELTDQRLHRFFDRADADHDGSVTRNELNVFLVRERAAARKGSSGFGRFGGGPPGFGGPGGGPPRPGEILPPFLRQRLQLTADQEKQIAELQRDVDARLEKILSAVQVQQLQEMRERGPGGFGPPGRFGAPGGLPGAPGGPPQRGRGRPEPPDRPV